MVTEELAHTSVHRCASLGVWYWLKLDCFFKFFFIFKIQHIYLSECGSYLKLVFCGF